MKPLRLLPYLSATVLLLVPPAVSAQGEGEGGKSEKRLKQEEELRINRELGKFLGNAFELNRQDKFAEALKELDTYEKLRAEWEEKGFEVNGNLSRWTPHAPGSPHALPYPVSHGHGGATAP